MSKLVAWLAVAALAAPALADLSTESGATFGGGAVVDYRTGQINWQGGASRGIVVYDDTTTVTAGFSQAPGAIIGDYLLMTGGGTLDSVLFSVYNSSSASGALESSRNTISFYDGPMGTFIGGFYVDLVYLPPLPQGYYATVLVTDLSSLFITVPSDVTVTQQITDVVGSNKVGQVLADPPTVGSSQDAFWLDNTVATPPGTDQGWFNFGGSTVANFYWQIAVPEPAAFTLLGLAGLLIRRR